MIHSSRSEQFPHGQRGNVQILFAVFFPVLLGFAALAIDVARLNLAKVQLQNAADAGALAGARLLSSTGKPPYSFVNVTTTAANVARENYPYISGSGSVLTTTKGYWNLSSPSPSFSLTSRSSSDVAAIKVQIDSGYMKTFFAPILDYGSRSTRKITARAVATIMPSSPTGTSYGIPILVQ
jgi:Flp pilus assembly protein TadG